MKVPVLIIALLITNALCVHIKLNEVSKPYSHHHDSQHHLSNGARQPVSSEDTKNTTPQLVDTELVVPTTLGKKSVNLVLDSTSYVSWVQSRNPNVAASRCDGCPATTTPFECQGTCKVVPNAPTTPYTAASFGGRVAEQFFLATESQTTVASTNVKNFQFGLVSKVTDLSATTVLPDHGVLGFGFGSDNVAYYRSQDVQLNRGVVQAQSSEQLNIVRLLNKQNGGIVPQPTVALKLEEGLNILTIGEPEAYFKLINGDVYDNQGTQFWQLQVTEINYGPFDDEVTPPTTPPAHGHRDAIVPPPTVAADYKFAFDTTTKFLIGPTPLVTDLVKILNHGGGQTCIAPTVNGQLISCTCADANAIKKFKPLSLRFNSKKTVHRIQPENYIQFKTDKCYVNLVLQSTAEQITVGQAFFKDNYVEFRQATNDVQISPAYPVAPTPLHIASNNRIAHIVIGSLLLLGALAYLLSVLKQIGHVPLTQSQVQAPAPRPVPVQAPLQTYSVVVPQQQYYQPQPQFIQTVGTPIYGQPLTNRSRHIPGGPLIR